MREVKVMKLKDAILELNDGFGGVLEALATLNKRLSAVEDELRRQRINDPANWS